MKTPQLCSPERSRFVEDLLSYMTLDEKIGQLCVIRIGSGDRRGSSPSSEALLDMVRAGKVAAIEGIASREEARQLQEVAVRESRFGIPLLLANTPDSSDANPWPQSLAMAASWDVEAVAKVARAVAAEAINQGWNLVSTPPVRLLNDNPEEGSNSFGSSEHVAARLSTAMIHGLQGDSPAARESVLGLLCYGPLKGGTSDGEATKRALRGILSSSDVAAISEIVENGEFDSSDPGAAIFEKFKGIDLGAWRSLAQMGNALPHEFDHEAIAAAIEDGHLSPALIDDAVRRVLAAKSDLGLFRDPFLKLESETETGTAVASQRDDACGNLARQSCLMLRNDDDVLPLSIDSGRLLLVCTDEDSTRSLHDNLEQAGIKHRWLTGLAIRGENLPDRLNPIPADRLAIGMASDAASRADTIIMVVTDADCVVERDRPAKRLGPAARALLGALCSAGKRLVLIEATSLPIDLGERSSCVAGQLLCWRGSSELEEILGDILTGELSPSGRLPFELTAWEGGRHLPLGYGLRYSEVHCSNLSVEFEGNCVVAQASLCNTGMYRVVETVLLYLRGWTRLGDAEPQLRAFQRVALEPGEKTRVRFELGSREMGEINAEGRYIIDPGPCEILVGCEPTRLSSRQIDLSEATIRAMLAIPGSDRRRAANA